MTLLTRIPSWRQLSALAILGLSSCPLYATTINAVEPNDTLETAQSIASASPVVRFSEDVGNSRSVSYISIQAASATGYDVFSFEATEGLTLTFDIDYASGSGISFDSYLTLYDANGNTLRTNDDSSTSAGAGGSTSGLDSYLSYQFSQTGMYYIEVGSCCKGPIGTGSYTLHISGWNDADGDGLSDNEEQTNGTDRNNPDSDSDGWNDGFEVSYGLDPTYDDRNADPDGDGLTNLQEVSAGSRPDMEDTDGDRLTDFYEVTVSNTSPTNTDTDSDGLTDSEELQVGTNPRSFDTDNDGMADGWEVSNRLNPLDRNDDLLDADNDGWLNVQEYQRGLNPQSFDASGSTVNHVNNGFYSVTGGGELVRIDVSDGSSEVIGSLGIGDDYEGLAVSPSGEMYAVGDSSRRLYRIDYSDGSATLVGYLGGIDTEYGLTFSPTGDLYLTDGRGLYTIDTATGAATLIGYSSIGNADALAWHDGRLYAISSPGFLYTVNTLTGQMQEVGPLGVSIPAQSGLTSAGARLIGYAESSGQIFTIDASTGAATVLSSTRTDLESLAYFAASYQSTVSDDDGMPGDWEVSYGLSPTDASDALLDSDFDGLINRQEYLFGGNPNIADTDGYGINDGDEVFIYRTDLADADTDNDGMSDGWEVDNGLNPLSSSDRNSDTDGDGLSNYNEYQNGTRADVSDTDNDGLDDNTELTVSNTNPVMADTDADGIPDGWEFDFGLNALVADSGLDSDSDSLTNLQEYQAGSSPLLTDTDSDGLSDSYEVNTSHTDPARWDTDRDGINDQAEILTYGTNPLLKDSDNDGLPDDWEVQYGTDPLIVDYDTDSDADGFTNAQEYAAGTDPQDSDTDGDGIADGSDGNPLTDSVAPVLVAVPAAMSFGENGSQQGMGYFVADTAFFNQFDATDNLDSGLDFIAEIDGQRLVVDGDQHINLPTGHHTLTWFAMDDDGNLSNGMQQVVDIYPQVRFERLTQFSGEGSSARVRLQLTGAAPFYPVTIDVEMDHALSDTDENDIDSAFLSKDSHQVVFAAAAEGQPAITQALLQIPVLQDSATEADEAVTLRMLPATLSHAEIAVAIGADETQLVITERNLPAEVSIVVEQGGQPVDTVVYGNGDVTLRAEVYDPNGADTHLHAWFINDLAESGVIAESSVVVPEFVFAANIEEFSIRVEVSDTGVAPQTSIATKQVKVDRADVEPSPDFEGNDSNRSSSGGAMMWWTLLLAMMAAGFRFRRYCC